MRKIWFKTLILNFIQKFQMISNDCVECSIMNIFVDSTFALSSRCFCVLILTRTPTNTCFGFFVSLTKQRRARIALLLCVAVCSTAHTKRSSYNFFITAFHNCSHWQNSWNYKLALFVFIIEYYFSYHNGL